jgi:transaldolase
MKFFADTADIEDIRKLADTGLLDGVTTNPSLIKKAGATLSRRCANLRRSVRVRSLPKSSRSTMAA